MSSPSTFQKPLLATMHQFKAITARTSDARSLRIFPTVPVSQFPRGKHFHYNLHNGNATLTCINKTINTTNVRVFQKNNTCTQNINLPTHEYTQTHRHTHRYAQRHTETHRDTQRHRHTQTHRDTQRHTEPHRDTQRHTETHKRTDAQTHTRTDA